MEERGLNIHSLAKRSNLSWNTIKNFYTRNTTPNIDTVSKLCDGLEISLPQFFETEGETTHLTAEQQHLVNRWNQLSAREKSAISEMMDIILEQRK